MRRSGGDHEREFREHQSRSRGTARRGSRLHDLRPGDDRRRRLADERLAHAGTEAICRRNLFSARGSLRAARLSARCCSESRRRGNRIAKRLSEQGTKIIAALRRVPRQATPKPPASSARRRSMRPINRSRAAYDAHEGGFGRAPKFPRPVTLNFLFRVYARERGIARAASTRSKWRLFTLRKMAAGGMHDHLGGGFHRYSVDSLLARPAFRKNALRPGAAGGRVPRRVSDHARTGIRRSRARYARLRPARHDREGGRILFRRGCRQRL